MHSLLSHAKMQCETKTRVKCEMSVYHEAWILATGFFFGRRRRISNQMQVWHTALGVLGNRVHLDNLWLIRGVCRGAHPERGPMRFQAVTFGLSRIPKTPDKTWFTRTYSYGTPTASISTSFVLPNPEKSVKGVSPFWIALTPSPMALDIVIKTQIIGLLIGCSPSLLTAGCWKSI